MPQGEKQRGVPPKVMIVTRRARLVEVEKMLALHIGPREIQRRICEKFHVTSRCVRGDIESIYKLWGDESMLEREDSRNQLRGTLKRILQLALAGSDLKAAVLVCDRLAKLDGLNEATKVDLIHGGKITLTDQEIDDRISKISESLSVDPAALQ
jgi:hypothetical protein